MNSIITVEQLTEVLDEIEPHEQAKNMKRLHIAAHELENYATWSSNGYTRNCLARTEKYELILLCWDAYAKTPIHDHGGEDCWVYQVQGTIEEIRFKQEAGMLKETNRMILMPGKLTYMNDSMGYHSLVNLSNQRAMTLHIYTLPIDTCEVYNDQKDCFEIKEMSYHTFKRNEVESPVS